MKTKILKLSTVALLFALIGVACHDNDELPPLEDKELPILEQQAQGCKENLKSSEIEQYIELKGEDENKLRLTFINAKINCAGLDTTYAFIQDGILKVVFWDYLLADCICDFDLECIIDSMENRSYDIEVYAAGEKPKANFSFVYSSELDSKIKISND